MRFYIVGLLLGLCFLPMPAAAADCIGPSCGGGNYIMSGNLGIGTNAPLDALSIGTTLVASATHALLNLSNTPLYGGSSSGTYLGANVPAGGPGDLNFIDFQNNNSSNFRVSVGGNVTAGGYAVADNGAETISGSWGIHINGTTNHPVQITAPLLVGYTASGGTYGPGNALISGSVGIGTTGPQATLDVNGYARLGLQSSQPAGCTTANQGAIALNHLAQICVCNGSAWTFDSSGAACSW